jgi:hypothetical protein
MLLIPYVKPPPWGHNSVHVFLSGRRRDKPRPLLSEYLTNLGGNAYVTIFLVKTLYYTSLNTRTKSMTTIYGYLCTP